MTIQLDSKLLSSCHINFLFGAGVNGSGFPQLNGFAKTKEFISELLGTNVKSFENSIEELEETDKKKAIECFKDEFRHFSKNIDYSNISLKNIDSLFMSVNKLVGDSENRTKTTKQINIYTLNYDVIVETVLQKSGFLVNVISSSNLENHNKFFNLIGYNSEIQTFIPTYLVSKIHGDIYNPILPGGDKYNQALMANKFEVLFQMKAKLSRFNSVLFLIGYSGNDEHINRILRDCVTCGLTIYWFKYSNNDVIPSDLEGKVFVIDNENKLDTTLVCGKMIDQLWDKSLEE
ncbi:MAG: SIR2 family protein [Bacilli bacterium]|jgi:hypothetical protein|nr:SIR2 family protein [Bacilli bacterium]MCH4235385.1 SIR2 family protein [Bacilli bacterium]